MKKITLWLLAAALLLAVTLPSAWAAGAGTVVYRNTQTLTDNLSIKNTISWQDEVGRQESFALTPGKRRGLRIPLFWPTTRFTAA